MEKEEEVVKGAGVIGHGKVAYYEASDQGDKVYSLFGFHGA